MIKPGEIDTTYGSNGYAIFPGVQPNESFHVGAAVAVDPDGSLSACGGSPSTSPTRYFVRLNADGSWNEEIGHKKIEISPSLPEGSQLFGLITRSNNVEPSYVAQSQTWSLTEDNKLLYSAAVGHFRSNFDPQPDFGDLGIKALLPDHEKTATDLKLMEAAVVKSQWVNGEIRSLYMSQRDRVEDEPTSWIALLDPTTGLPVNGLGEDLSQSQLALPRLRYDPDLPAYSMIISDSHFFDDGSFLVAASINWKQIIVKFDKRGVLDRTFGVAGQQDITGFRNSIKLHVDVSKNRILVGAGTPRDLGKTVILLRGFDLNGMPDPSFGTNGAVTLFFDDESIAVVGIDTDAAGNIMIASNHRVGNRSTGVVTRLLPDGAIDHGFGMSGHYKNSEILIYSQLHGNDELRLVVFYNDRHAGMKLFI